MPSQTNQNMNEEGIESPFGIEELFFSRTDERGVIAMCNAVFTRVSGHDWDDLLGAPHKIIRHPDMPRAVFWLLWEQIKAGKPIGAYVKNRAKNGSYYWVFALITPIPGGFLSVRLKPSSPLLATIRDEYRALRRSETEDGTAPEDSAAKLLAHLSELGWHSYHTFMTDALTAEIGARHRAIHGADSPAISAMRRIIKSSGENLNEASHILTLCEKLKYSAVNLSIHSAKNSAHRQIFGAISANFARVSEQLRSKVEAFIEVASGVFDQMNTALFLVATAELQAEMARAFRTEEPQGAQDDQKEARFLEQQSEEYRRRADENLRAMQSENQVFQWRCEEMLEHVGALGVTGTVGLIETARLDRGGAVAFQLLEETAAIQQDMEEKLRAMMSRNTELSQRLRLANGYGRENAMAPGGHGGLMVA